MSEIGIRGSRLSRFGQWLGAHWDKEYILTPIALCNRKRVWEIAKGHELIQTIVIGYTDVYVFGIRVISIQRTKPW